MLRRAIRRFDLGEIEAPCKQRRALPSQAHRPHLPVPVPRGPLRDARRPLRATRRRHLRLQPRPDGHHARSRHHDRRRRRSAPICQDGTEARVQGADWRRALRS